MVPTQRQIAGARSGGTSNVLRATSIPLNSTLPAAPASVQASAVPASRISFSSTATSVDDTDGDTPLSTSRPYPVQWNSGVQEFLRPLLFKQQTACALSEHAASYVNLLRESTTSNAQFSSHLLKLFARSALDTAKVAKCLADPSAGFTDLALDAGCTWLVHARSHNKEGATPHASPSSASAPSCSPGTAAADAHAHTAADAAPCSPSTASLTADDGHGTHSSPASSSIAFASDSTLDAATPTPHDTAVSPFLNVPPDSGSWWRRLRQYVHGARAFKSAGSKDDSCLRDGLSHLHAKALSVMLSIMLSGVPSSVLPDSIASSAASAATTPAAALTMSISSPVAASPIWGNTGKAVMNVIHEAPSITSYNSGASLMGAAGSILTAHNSTGVRAGGHAAGELLSHSSSLLARGGSLVRNASLSSELVTSLGGAVASAAERLLRADSKNPIRDVLSGVGPMSSMGPDGWASVSMDAAGAVLEVLVESVDKVDKESRASGTGGLSMGAMSRFQTLPRDFFSGLQKTAGSAGASAALSMTKSYK